MAKFGPSFLSEINCESRRDVLANIDYFDDPVCGPYGITGLARTEIEETSSLKFNLLCVLVQRRIRGSDRPTLIASARTILPTGAERWEVRTIAEILSEFPRDASAMLDNTLLNLAARASHPSNTFQVPANQPWQTYSPSMDSAQYMLNELSAMGLVSDVKAHFPQGQGGYELFCRLTARGWARVAELQAPTLRSRKQAFVAMWFDPSMEEFFQLGMKPAVEADSGLVCTRIDLTHHNNKICDQIIAEIRKSRFVIADFTGSRGGVYFEAGYAQGLGLPVIWTVRKDHLKDVHFDTRQYNHIVYEKHQELRQMLAARIAATIL